MKISILSASIRPEGLDIVKQSLDRQDFPHDQFEWIVVGNYEVCKYLDPGFRHHEKARTFSNSPYYARVIQERPKREGDFYNIDKAYNDLFKHASGQLAVMWTDLTWAPGDALTNFWKHYEDNPRACVGGVGDQYDPSVIEFGKPQLMLWKDPRKRLDQGSFYEVSPVDFEMCLASIPVRAMRVVGGFDEEYDRGAAVGEKEVALRMEKAGYKFYLDQSIEYRAIKHPRILGTEEWDKHYAISCDLLRQHIPEINEGIRLKLDYLKVAII